jgi:glycosyltransferase involved in cell wall biosynthesis
VQQQHEFMSRLRISIITPSYNQRQFIERTIQSVLSQKGEFELEYLILDGGSTDGTLEVLQKYNGALSWKSEPDQGQTDAINKGLQQVRGDIVGWLNSDDLLAPGALSRVTDAFQSNPQLDWLHGRCDIVDVNDQVIRKWISAYKHWCCQRYSYSRLLTENFISQMTVFWRRRLLEEAGYLNTNLKLAFDYDLWLRFAQRSAPLYISERLASFRWYETSKSGANFIRQFTEDYNIACRYAPDRQWLRWRKRVNMLRTIWIYKGMSLFRARRIY